MTKKSSIINEKKESWNSITNCIQYEIDQGEFAHFKDEDNIRSLLGNNVGLFLDIPCGAGRFSIFLKEKGKSIIAGDYSYNMVSMTKIRVDIPVVRCDIFHLPFKDNTFDNILCLRLLFHYPNPQEIIKELKRVVKKNGFIAVDTLNKYSVRYFAQFYIKMRGESVREKIFFLSQKEFIEKIEDFHLQIITKRSAYILPSRQYKKLPEILVSFLDKFEVIWPQTLRNLTYWKIKKC